MALIEKLRERIARLVLLTLYKIRMIKIALGMRPVMGADDGGGDGGEGNDGAAAEGEGAEGAGASAGDGQEGEDGEGRVAPEDDWKTKARKHERDVKKASKRIADLEKALKEREDADKSDHEKALEKAREEGRNEALTEAQKSQRHDRLDIAATKAAVKGVELKDGDETTLVKFADPDDALIYVERAIANGDVDEDEIFDSEGKVNTEALQKALGEILEQKPHLRDGGNEKRRVTGDADAGKGAAGGPSLEDMSVDDHLKAIQKPRN